MTRNLLFCVLSLLLTACFNSQTKLQGLVVLNVLDAEYYQDCHIKGSFNAPFEQIAAFAERIDQMAEIVIYCSNYRCTSSTYVAKQLKQLGFENVAVYEGGTAEWYQKGLPTEGPHKKAYLTKEMQKIEIAGEIPTISAELLAQKMGYMAA